MEESNEYSQTLELLKSLFPNQAILYVPEIAIALGKSDIAVRRSIERRTLPVKKFAGRIGISIVEMARFMVMGDVSDEKPSRKKPPIAPTAARVVSSAAPRARAKRAPTVATTPPPKITRRLPSLVSLIAKAKLQAEFFNALSVELERLQLSNRVKKKEQSLGNLPKRGSGKGGAL
jgi:hypothetical protein